MIIKNNNKPFKIIHLTEKIMIAALMMIMSSTVFTGDSDALKAILKAKPTQKLRPFWNQISDS